MKVSQAILEGKSYLEGKDGSRLDKNTNNIERLIKWNPQIFDQEVEEFTAQGLIYKEYVEDNEKEQKDIKNDLKGNDECQEQHPESQNKEQKEVETSEEEVQIDQPTDQEEKKGKK